MFTASDQLNVTLICGPTDKRKAIDGLCNIVAYDLKKEPCSDHIFVFCGRVRDKVEILQWASNGFWLHYKRLEKGHFQWPGIDDEQLSIQVSPRQLNWLLDGLSLNVQDAHPHLTYRYHDD
ncbi:IS66 family insertion sequence element accessory protein TnpB [Marinomonas sp. TI.3.20]|uniref:IS66 family insertion sequence element accessory protein TnpB n=1 Tax=Marinomonas sp. TI.3.20 TaxID=3121296 RepID=UPI00311F8DD1